MLHFLQEIAPQRLLNYRTHRYKGETHAVALSLLGPQDAIRVRELYEYLGTFLRHLDGLHVFDADQTSSITTAQVVKGFPLTRAREHLVRLGSDTFDRMVDDDLELSLHDARGGSLGALLTLLEWLLHESQPDPRPHLSSLFYYTRDQLKILRNAFLELDDDHRRRDLEFKTHDVRTIVDKLQLASRFRNNKPAYLTITGDFDGQIAACCCESAALDRIIHNGLDNAYRHSRDNTVRFTFFPVPDVEGPDLRIVISNPLSAEDETRLSHLAKQEGTLHALFARGTSSTRSGLGLAIIGNFIAEAYGLRTVEETLQQGYTGCTCHDGYFHLWCHWPIVRG